MGRRFGFTLAEVLITLAIIGVVAVLTIPTLVANYQEKGWNTSATVFERKLEESLKIMNTQGTLAGYRTTEAFVNELQKHLKITRVCKNDDLQSCFEETVMWGGGDADPTEVDMSKVKTSKHFGQKDWGTNLVGIQLANGTSGLIAYNPECNEDRYSNTFVGTSCVAILYDTSGYAKPNTSGKDLRAINVAKLGNNCAFELGGTCFVTPFFPTPMTYAECAGENATSANKITAAGKEASALGIKQCYYENDYWAGAVKTCGGIQNMPTMAQLAEIAKYVYNKDNITVCGMGQSYVTRDDSKTSSLGFDINGTNQGEFNIWSNEEYGPSYTYRRGIAKYQTYSTYTGRNDRGSSYKFYAVCLGE